ncbi:N-glycosylase/DNA lyase [Candidatus Bathyarchaeota archaeon]|nr:N-glycosylase/DNA lyase [Candidatus Bathyarchaeota archaeon]
MKKSSGLDKLVEAVKKLKNSEVRNLIDARVKEFMENRNKPIDEIFKELCFCLLTANFSAERSLRIQEEIGDGFLTLPENELAEKLRELGHRYPKSRAKYIVKARKMVFQLENVLHSSLSERALRDWLVKNVVGLGYKEASHFLRNIGFMNLAIIDIHVIDILSRYGVIRKPRALTKRKYMKIEEALNKIAEKMDLSLGVLDLYLWYMETGKVLK